jgi:hypothetical protein
VVLFCGKIITFKEEQKMDKNRLNFLRIYLENYTAEDLLTPLIQGGFDLQELEELGYEYNDIMVAWAKLYNAGEFDSMLKEEA